MTGQSVQRSVEVEWELPGVAVVAEAVEAEAGRVVAVEVVGSRSVVADLVVGSR